MMSNGVSNLVSASGLSGFRAQGGQCSNTLDFQGQPTFAKRLPRNAWLPEPRTGDLEANQGHRRTAGSLDAAEAIEPTSTTALAKEAEAVARCQELIGEEPIRDPLKTFRNQQSTIGLSKKAMTAKTHRTHKDVDPGTQSLIDRIADDSSLKAPPMPKRPNLKSGTTKSKLQALSRYIHAFEYNHTGKSYFKMSRDRGLKHVHFTAREIIREALPIQCVEAVFLAVHLTAELDCLDLRVPLSFKSKCGESHYRHIVLAVRDGSTGKWGSLGISRRKVLAYKEPTFESLSTLVLDFQLSYKQCDHDLVKIYLGLPFPSGLHSVDPIKWRVLKQELTDEWAKKVDKYSKDCNWVREYHLSTGGLPEPYNGTSTQPKAAVPKNKKRRRKKKKKKAGTEDEPVEGEYDPEKYTEDDEVLGSDSDESGCESDGAVVASDGGEEA